GREHAAAATGLGVYSPVARTTSLRYRIARNPVEIDLVDLRRFEKFSRVIDPDPLAYEHVEKVRVDMPRKLHLAEDRERFRHGFGALVGAVFSGQGFEHVGDGDHSGR